MSEARILHWKAPGAVTRAFMHSTKRNQSIMGPVGSGKTSTIVVKAGLTVQRQAPSLLDGIRKFKLCCVRDTYRRLWETTIPSWWEWFPKESGLWHGGAGEPAIHEIRMQLMDGTRAELIVEFIAIGDQKIEDVLRGYQPTAFWLNEGDRLSRAVFEYCSTRTGRYPRQPEGGPTWWGIWTDFNAPDVENWTYDVFVENKNEDTDFFRQPSGLSPEAENLENLPPGYYQDMMRTLPEWLARRLVKNEFGYSRDGLPVYPEWNDHLHVAAEPLKPSPGLPLLLGIDAGRTPALVLGQSMPDGQLRIIDEILGENMGAERFAEFASTILARDHAEWAGAATPSWATRLKHENDLIYGWADPSAAFASDSNESSWIQIFSAKAKIRIRPAPTNNLTPRLEAVRQRLTRMIDGHKPAWLISPKCKALRKGFNSGYRYRRIQIAGSDRYEEKPEKNEFSHVHDGAQYFGLGAGDYSSIMGRERQLDGGPRQTRAVMDDDEEDSG